MIQVSQNEYDFSFNRSFDGGVEEAGTETGLYLQVVIPTDPIDLEVTAHDY